ncbi:hypothetical protein [Myxococcus sp. CA040A]|uniref:hypothetical protein n=1 Tax=Myxococcus sp. CA040A TaxID=2741738 RepID=UPI00157B9916|nr:hypothetical protein [Myxococcus sp. CA040A]NTX08955.1 hypothetical protein [Myxococcus sp. CA040A]
MYVPSVQLRIFAAPGAGPLVGPRDPRARYSIYVEGALRCAFPAGTTYETAQAEVQRIRASPPK